MVCVDVVAADTVCQDNSKTDIPDNSGLPSPVVYLFVSSLVSLLPLGLLYVSFRVACVPVPTCQLFV